MARILGIDIEQSAVRAVLVKSQFRRTELDSYVELPLTEPLQSPGRLPEVHDALAGLLRTLGKPPDSLNTALHGEQASLRVIELPLAAAKRAGEVLPFELESM